MHEHRWGATAPIVCKPGAKQTGNVKQFFTLLAPMDAAATPSPDDLFTVEARKYIAFKCPAVVRHLGARGIPVAGDRVTRRELENAQYALTYIRLKPSSEPVAVRTSINLTSAHSQPSASPSSLQQSTPRSQRDALPISSPSPSHLRPSSSATQRHVMSGEGPRRIIRMLPAPPPRCAPVGV